MKEEQQKIKKLPSIFSSVLDNFSDLV